MLEPTLSLLKIHSAASVSGRREKESNLCDFIFQIIFQEYLFFVFLSGYSASYRHQSGARSFTESGQPRSSGHLGARTRVVLRSLVFYNNKSSYSPSTYQCLAHFIKGGNEAQKQILKESSSWSSGGVGFCTLHPGSKRVLGLKTQPSQFWFCSSLSPCWPGKEMFAGTASRLSLRWPRSARPLVACLGPACEGLSISVNLD